MFVWKRPKINKKRGQGWPIFKKRTKERSESNVYRKGFEKEER